MINKLIKLADRLDRLGMPIRANHIDKVIFKLGEEGDKWYDYVKGPYSGSGPSMTDAENKSEKYTARRIPMTQIYECENSNNFLYGENDPSDCQRRIKRQEDDWAKKNNRLAPYRMSSNLRDIETQLIEEGWTDEAIAKELIRLDARGVAYEKAKNKRQKELDEGGDAALFEKELRKDEFQQAKKKWAGAATAVLQGSHDELHSIVEDYVSQRKKGVRFKDKDLLGPTIDDIYINFIGHLNKNSSDIIRDSARIWPSIWEDLKSVQAGTLQGLFLKAGDSFSFSELESQFMIKAYIARERKGTPVIEECCDLSLEDTWRILQSTVQNQNLSELGVSIAAQSVSI